MTPDGSAPLPPATQMLPAGWIGEVVTYLEMRAPPPLRPDPATGLVLKRLPADVARYRRLFRRVGEPWLWASQLRLGDGQLEAVLASEDRETYALCAVDDVDADEIGLLQLDFRQAGDCELAFFGVMPEAVGRGAGRFLMNRAIERAWGRAPGLGRFWVHTCSNDHPEALAFYIRSGFVPYARGIECYPDPRLAGLLPMSAAPQVPIV